MNYDAELRRLMALEAENAALKESIQFWKEDSAAGWDKCEERRKELLAAQHRIKELREALENVTHSRSGCISQAISILEHPDNTAEIDALVKDAERYRWLRIHSVQPAEPWSNHHRPESFDEAIDAAMKEGNHAPD